MVDYFCRDRNKLSAVALVSLLGLVGCGRGHISSYQVPKSTNAASPSMETAQATPTAPTGAPALPQVHWKLPTGWHEVQAGQMVVACFQVTGSTGQTATVTIVPLGGEGGGELPNVNRWRGQIGLGSVTATAMQQEREAVTIAGQSGEMFDFAGKSLDGGKPTRLMAAILHQPDTTWFFKMMGDDQLVAKQKPAFVQFLKSISFTAPSAAGAGSTAMGSAPAGQNPPVISAPPAAPHWSVPAGWQTEKVGPMQTAHFEAPGKGGNAEITVVALPGSAGGELANVNRWRGQMGLKPVTEAQMGGLLLKVKIPGTPVYAVALKSADGKQAMIAVAVTEGSTTWFYKVTGAAAAVARVQPAFLQFVQTVKYGS